MCTLTWLASPGGYQVFFNRDELNTRQRALPPELSNAHTVQVIAPQDTDAGGTWICVNGHGTALCLLNNYAAAAAIQRDDWISRGLLVRNLAHLHEDAVIPAIEIQDLERFRGFDLVIFGRSGIPRLLSWNGTDLTVTAAPRMPITSSSFDTTRIIGERMNSFRQSPANANPSEISLDQFHHHHGERKGAASVCMHRDDASTVSFSHILVTDSLIEFNYRDGPPCEQGPTSSITITPGAPRPGAAPAQRMQPNSQGH